MIVLNYKDVRPINEQVVDKFEELILLGVMKQGEPMPSVRSLAMELSINPNTIQRAYAELERRGVIDTVKGKGSFVSSVDVLRQRKKEEFKQRLSQELKEAVTLQIPKDELLRLIDHAYQGANLDGQEIHQTNSNVYQSNQHIHQNDPMDTIQIESKEGVRE